MARTIRVSQVEADILRSQARTQEKVVTARKREAAHRTTRRAATREYGKQLVMKEASHRRERAEKVQERKQEKIISAGPPPAFSKEQIRERNQQQRAQQRAQDDIAQQQRQRAQMRRRMLVGAGAGAANSVVGALPQGNAGSISAPNTGSNITLVIAFFFVLVLAYNLVSHPGTSSGFISTLGNWISGLTGTTPLFSTKSTG